MNNVTETGKWNGKFFLADEHTGAEQWKRSGKLKRTRTHLEYLSKTRCHGVP